MKSNGESVRKIVITGVTRGLGRALVGEFTRLGHKVAGCGRDAKRIQELQTTFPAPHSFDALDVGNNSEVAAWAESVIKSLGVPDLLINNAAIINRNAKLWEVSAGEFDQVTRININGVANVIRHFVPAMVARKTGVIVNLSSGWGRSTDVDVAPYCATKWAIEGLTQSLAQELPEGMAAVPLNPGIINTEMLQSCFGAASARSFPTAEQWAKRAAPFLLGLGPKNNGSPMTAPG